MSCDVPIVIAVGCDMLVVRVLVVCAFGGDL